MKRSKKWRAAAELFNRDEMHTPIAALRLVKQGATTKFDATVDVATVASSRTVMLAAPAATPVTVHSWRPLAAT